MNNQRKIVAQILVRVEKDIAYSNIALNDALKSYNLNKTEASFVSTLFYGVLERKITLDYYIEKLSSKPIKRIPIFTLQVLRCGIYQLLYMDKVPDSAAVNEAVNIVKKSKEYRCAGFVNAILRNILRSLPKLPDNDSADAISIKYSCSLSLVKRLINDYGTESTKKILESSFKKNPVHVRTNTTLITTSELKNLFEENNIKCESTEIENALSLRETGSLENNKLFIDGFFHVQDLSSQICSNLLCAIEGQRVLDICAAPGGKSFTVCENMNDNGEIVSCDIHEHRVKLIQDGASRLKLKSINAKKSDATQINTDFINSFDRVLCDVPCTGSGVIGRKPDIKYKNFDNNEDINALQLLILKNSFEYLKSDGLLVYSTCSILRDENEAVINAFLNNNQNAELLSMKTYLPHIDNTDGFFTAVIKKR